MRIELHAQQSKAFTSTATEILYGGAGGGGKSHLMRAVAISAAVAVPGLRVGLFRRLFPALKANHFEGRTSLPMLLAPMIAAKKVRYNISDLAFRFANGSHIVGKHFQFESDFLSLQGDEYDLVLIDELTHFTAKMYRYIRSRCRSAGLVVPAKCLWTFPRILASANPGGTGHTWVKEGFIDPVEEGEIWRTPPEEGGMLRQFIRAKLADNPSLNEAEYKTMLQGLGDPALVKAMLEGDWDVVAGGMLDDVFDRKVHVIEPFRVPASWKVDRSFDWGSSKPFSICWWAESDGTDAKLADGTTRSFPKGTVFCIAEWYGWNGKANEGCRMLASEIARGIKEREEQMRTALISGAIRPGPADTAIFDTQNGSCIANDMALLGVRWERAQKGPGSRVNGWEKVRQVLAAAKVHPMEKPGLLVFSTCRQFLRTVPVLPRDPAKSDDVDSDSEDHVGDALRYRLTDAKRAAGEVTI